MAINPHSPEHCACASACQFDKLLELRARHYGRVSTRWAGSLVMAVSLRWSAMIPWYC